MEMSVVPECNNALVIVQNIIKNISQPTSIIMISGLFEFELVSIDLDDATITNILWVLTNSL